MAAGTVRLQQRTIDPLLLRHMWIDSWTLAFPVDSSCSAVAWSCAFSTTARRTTTCARWQRSRSRAAQAMMAPLREDLHKVCRPAGVMVAVAFLACLLARPWTHTLSLNAAASSHRRQTSANSADSTGAVSRPSGTGAPASGNGDSNPGAQVLFGAAHLLEVTKLCSDGHWHMPQQPCSQTHTHTQAPKFYQMCPVTSVELQSSNVIIGARGLPTVLSVEFGRASYVASAGATVTTAHSARVHDIVLCAALQCFARHNNHQAP